MTLHPQSIRHGASVLALLLAVVNGVSGQERDVLSGLLERRVEDFSVQGQEAKVVLEGIGAGYRFPIVVEPDVQGTVTFEVHNATVRTVLEAICQPKGWSYELTDRSFVLVRRFVTRIYPVDYLQMTQTGSSSASINLSESVGIGASGSLGLANGGIGVAGAGPNAGSGGNPQGQLGSSATVSGGSSTLSVSQQNDADFWGRLESDLKGMVGDGESLVVNRFAGLVQLRGSLRTHAVMESYLRRVLQRVGRQARISVKILEVDLNDQSKTGIDWSLASASLGRIAHTALSLNGLSTATGAIAQIGSVALSPNTFSGTIAAGGVQAVISALSEQGNVRIESKPEIAALNNQTAFVQVSEDQPFFSRTSTTTINAGGTIQAGTQPIVNTNYTESTVSFGNVLEITVQIADDLTTKLSLSPAMTELKGTVTSPDGQETAPITGTKRARTTVTLRNHETAVVGGFITETTAKDRRAVPLLSGLPILGAAFATAAGAKTRTELVFLVTVNAEEPPALVPIDVDRPAPAKAAHAAAGPLPDRRTERLGLGGGAT
ncbi:MAG TPA: secretin N-terminal domain-containing protein [Opitutaceae bacterium]|jgi:type II secretory pathway component GspD/PulD (secretin)